MFQASSFANVARVPHGQTIHVSFPGSGRCDEWVVLDYERAWSPEFKRIIMNWPNNDHSRNAHWEWECGTP